MKVSDAEIKEALIETKGVVMQAADLLPVTKQALHDRIKHNP